MRFQVIFDLDDTLINSFEGYCRVHRMTALALGLEALSHEALTPYELDFVTTLTAQYAHVPGFDPNAFVDHWNRIADDHPYQAIPGVREALGRLSEAGHELWIVTSRSRQRLAQRMREGGLVLDWFRGVFPREDQPRQKPHPECFEPIWQRLGARPGPSLPCVFIGDREADRRAAAAAGIPFVAVRTGPEARLGFPRDLPPTHVLDSAAEVPRWLEHHGR